MHEFKLTPAEYDTIALVSRGLTNPEIARLCCISPNTVRNRLAVCFRKLGASRRAEATFLFTQVDSSPPAQAREASSEYRRWVAAAGVFSKHTQLVSRDSRPQDLP